MFWLPNFWNIYCHTQPVGPSLTYHIPKHCRDLKWRVSWTLCLAILGWAFHYISRIHTAYIGENLHFRYMKCSVISPAKRKKRFRIVLGLSAFFETRNRVALVSTQKFTTFWSLKTHHIEIRKIIWTIQASRSLDSKCWFFRVFANRSWCFSWEHTLVCM